MKIPPGLPSKEGGNSKVVVAGEDGDPVTDRLDLPSDTAAIAAGGENQSVYPIRKGGRCPPAIELQRHPPVGGPRPSH